MKLVIDIDERVYKEIVYEYDTFPYQMKNYGLSAIKNGTPLPKGHGDLVDRNAIEVLRIGNTKREYDKGFDAGVSCMVNRILEAPTIIEADKESD